MIPIVPQWNSAGALRGARALLTALALAAGAVVVRADVPQVTVAVRADVPQVTVAVRGGRYQIRGEFLVAVPPAAVWEVLTDYEHIPLFVESVKRSDVDRRADGMLRVRQIATVGIPPFRRTARVDLDLHEEDEHSITFTDLLGRDFSHYSGEWTLRVDSTGSHVGYALDASPKVGIPGWLGRGIMSHGVRELLAQVRAEIQRRAALP